MADDVANELTAKQQEFCEQYMVDLNGTQAAIRAGYSEHTAKEIAYELLTKLHIKARVAELKAAQSDRTTITADKVLHEIARLAFSDLRRLMTPAGHLINPQDWDDDTAAAVSSVEVVTYTPRGEDKPIEYTHKIKAWDKNSALEKLCKHLGLTKERLEHSSPGGGPPEFRITIVDPERSRD